MDDRRKKAIEIVKNMMPAAASQVENPDRTGFGSELGDLALDMVFGPLWTREGLDLRTRSLVNVAILIALRAHSELEFHGPAAIRNGATVAELEEVVYQAAGYAGFPAGASARKAIGDALAKAGMI